MKDDIEDLRRMLSEIRETILSNAAQIAAVRAVQDALIFTHPDLPLFHIALTRLLDRQEAVLNGQAQDSVIDTFQRVRAEVLAFVAEGLEQSAKR